MYAGRSTDDYSADDRREVVGKVDPASSTLLNSMYATFSTIRATPPMNPKSQGSRLARLH